MKKLEGETLEEVLQQLHNPKLEAEIEAVTEASQKRGIRAFNADKETGTVCFTIASIPGWQIVGTPATAEGRAGLRSLVIKPLDNDSEALLSTPLLKQIPLPFLAKLGLVLLGRAPYSVALHREGIDTVAQLRGNATPTVAAVANVWNYAFDTGRAPRKTVCEEFNIASRTADNYIQKARRQGLITRSARPWKLSKTSDAKEATATKEIGKENE